MAVNERSLGFRKKVLGPDHPTVGQSLNNLALLYQDQGRYAEAEPPQTRLGNSREGARQDRYDEAEPLLKRSLVVSKKAFGPDHPNVAAGLKNLAGVYRDQGRYAEAEPLFKRALAIAEVALGPGHPIVAATLADYAALFRETGRDTKAAKMEARAKAIRLKRAKENM